MYFYQRFGVEKFLLVFFKRLEKRESDSKSKRKRLKTDHKTKLCVHKYNYDYPLKRFFKANFKNQVLGIGMFNN